MIRLTPHSNYLAILHDTESLQHNAETYLNQCISDHQPPTPAGLSLALGFSSFSQLKAAMKRAIIRQTAERSSDNADPDTIIFEPPPFLPIIDAAFSHIEDQYLRAALLDEFKATTVQYALAAYFDRQPINKSQTQTEINQTTNQQIKVIIEDSTTTAPAISEEDKAEIERLKNAITVEATPIPTANPTTANPTAETKEDLLDAII